MAARPLRVSNRLVAVWFLAAGSLLAAGAPATLAPADDPLPSAKPVPRMQVEPQPYQQAAVLRDGQEIARYHFGETLRRPFVFPLIGPSGRSLTRMAHPRDPNGHSHHNSFWVSHNQIDGVDFWGDKGAGRIVHQRVLEYEDTDSEARIAVQNAWLDGQNARVLDEERRLRFVPLEQGEWLLLLELKLTAVEKPRVIGKSSFGFVGVRMAKTIGVHDGGGTIRNSEGGVDEKGVFWKEARWVDYSGRVTSAAVEGIALMDHPGNPGFPNPYHVRDDGWMGCTTTFRDSRELSPGQPQTLRYGLYIHRGLPARQNLDRQFERFVELTK